MSIRPSSSGPRRPLAPPSPCLLLLALLPACGTVREWQELQTGPASRAEVYDAVEFLARTDGFAPEVGACDRGLAVWESRWRFRQLGLGRPGRFRLRAEILIDDGSAETGWIVRYCVEQQQVKDLKKSMDPAEEDWSDGGQDGEREFLFGERLRRRLATIAGPVPTDSGL
ncbi:MAG: hypothetical protein AB7O97_23425 [Planctomycetota bacterium]